MLDMKDYTLMVIASPVLIPAIAMCFVISIPIVIVYMVIPSLKSSYMP